DTVSHRQAALSALRARAGPGSDGSLRVSHVAGIRNHLRCHGFVAGCAAENRPRLCAVQRREPRHRLRRHASRHGLRGYDLAHRHLRAARARAGERAIGFVYSANTVGAIAGVVIALHFALPLLGLKNTIVTAATVDLALGVMLMACGD